MSGLLERVEIRRVNGRWQAFAGAWSTSLGDVTVAEILTLFRSSTIIFLPPTRSKK